MSGFKIKNKSQHIYTSCVAGNLIQIKSLIHFENLMVDILCVGPIKTSERFKESVCFSGIQVALVTRITEVPIKFILL